jgi:hypothetical protein
MILDTHASTTRCREGTRCQRGAPAACWPWRRVPGDEGPGQARRYRPRGLTSRIEEILLSLMPWSLTCR